MSEWLLPWRALTWIAPYHTLAQISDYTGLEPDRWRLVSGLFEQETEQGLFRVDLNDALLVFSPTWEGDLLPQTDRPLPPRRLELELVGFYLSWSGLKLLDPELRGASGWEPCLEPAELAGYFALRGRLAARGRSGESFPVEFHSHGEVRAEERAQALYAAECVLGLHRLSHAPR